MTNPHPWSQAFDEATGQTVLKDRNGEVCALVIEPRTADRLVELTKAEDLDELEDKIYELEDKIAKLEEQVGDLEDELREANSDLDDANNKLHKIEQIART